MKYQLVLQFSGGSLNDFDEVVKLEDQIATLLQQQADVDGHDFGSDEANIFILTNEPVPVFERLLPLIEMNKPQLSAAAYRDLDGEDYTVLWPVSSKKKFQII
jgi:hypothetical protein